jgi:hypothetical protein
MFISPLQLLRPYKRKRDPLQFRYVLTRSSIPDKPWESTVGIQLTLKYKASESIDMDVRVANIAIQLWSNAIYILQCWGYLLLGFEKNGFIDFDGRRDSNDGF